MASHGRCHCSLPQLPINSAWYFLQCGMLLLAIAAWVPRTAGQRSFLSTSPPFAFNPSPREPASPPGSDIDAGRGSSSSGSTNHLGIAVGVSVAVGVVLLLGFAAILYRLCCKPPPDPHVQATDGLKYVQQRLPAASTNAGSVGPMHRSSVAAASYFDDDAKWWNSLPPMARMVQWVDLDKEQLLAMRLQADEAAHDVSNEHFNLTSDEVLSQVKLVKNGYIAQADVESLTWHGSAYSMGAFGVVFVGIWQRRVVAVKMMHATLEAVQQELASFSYEIDILSNVRHPNIVRLYCGCMEPPTVCLVEELLDTSLDRRVHGASSGPKPAPLTAQEVLLIGRDLAQGLAYLHPNIVHRDLKPANVLLDVKGHARISDLGLARCKADAYLQTVHLNAGTTAYLAPECFDPEVPKSHAVDIFSLGVLLWECWTGQRPWAGLDHIQVMYAVRVKKQRLPFPGDVSLDRGASTSCSTATTISSDHLIGASGSLSLYEHTFRINSLGMDACRNQDLEPLCLLIKLCWHHNPSKRPSAKQVLEQLEGMLSNLPAG